MYFVHSASSHRDKNSKAPFQFLLSVEGVGGGVTQISKSLTPVQGKLVPRNSEKFSMIISQMGNHRFD